jgi:hypothetical protein
VLAATPLTTQGLSSWGETPLPVEGGADAQSLTPATVLVADDESPIRQLLRRQLEALGCTVLEAESGPEALRLVLSCRGTSDFLRQQASLIVMRRGILAAYGESLESPKARQLGTVVVNLASAVGVAEWEWSG